MCAVQSGEVGWDANMNIGGSVNDEIVIDKMCAMANVLFKPKVLDWKVKTHWILNENSVIDTMHMHNGSVKLLHHFIIQDHFNIFTNS